MYVGVVVFSVEFHFRAGLEILLLGRLASSYRLQRGQDAGRGLAGRLGLVFGAAECGARDAVERRLEVVDDDDVAEALCNEGQLQETKDQHRRRFGKSMLNLPLRMD